MLGDTPGNATPPSSEGAGFELSTHERNHVGLDIPRPSANLVEGNPIGPRHSNEGVDRTLIDLGAMFFFLRHALRLVGSKANAKRISDFMTLLSIFQRTKQVDR